MKTYLLLALIFLFVNSYSYAQLPERPYSAAIPQQSVYLEAGGNGLIYSLNYDLLFSTNWGARLGGSYYPIDMKDETNSSAFLGIIMGYRAIGNKSHKLEMGAGLLFGTIYDRTRWDYIHPPGGTFSFGYRFYPRESGHVTFKAAFTPIISRTGFHPRIGISLGITLNAEGYPKKE